MRTLLLLTIAILLILPKVSLGQNALHFDGTDDYVITTFPGVLGNTNRTFEAWVYVDPSAPVSNLCIVDYGLNAVGSRNSFSVSGSRGLTFISGGTNANISSSGGEVPVGKWTHVAFVLNNAVGFLYVNGVQVGTGNLSTVNTPSGNQNLSIGQRVPGGASFIRFEGMIDEVRIWNVARTPGQLQGDTLNEFCSPPSGLAAYYKFNQGAAGGNNAGLTTLNEHVAGNNGSLVNFSLNGSTSNWVTGKSLIPPAPVMASDTVTACDSYTSPSGSQVWTSSGIYTDTITGGCDTIMTIDLTILNSTIGSQNAMGCDSVISPSGNHVYYISGMYMDTIPNGVGCDSVISLNVIIPVIDDSISVAGNELIAQQSGASYQWLDCDAGMAAIPGATSQNYTISSSGNYAVEINLDGCIDTSDCVLAFFTGLKDATSAHLQVYPNPSKGEIFIQGDFEGTLSVVNVKGEEVHSTILSGNAIHAITLPTKVPSGLYFLIFENEKLSLRSKVLIIRE